MTVLRMTSGALRRPRWNRSVERRSRNPAERGQLLRGRSLPTALRSGGVDRGSVLFVARNRRRKGRLHLGQEKTVLRTGGKSGFSLVAVAAGTLDEITEIEIKLAFAPIAGDGGGRHFSCPFHSDKRLIRHIYDLQCSAYLYHGRRQMTRGGAQGHSGITPPCPTGRKG